MTRSMSAQIRLALAAVLFAGLLALVSLGAAPAGQADEAAPAATGPTFSGDTNRPELSTFAWGEKVELTFAGENYPADTKDLKLSLRAVDALDQEVGKTELPLTVAADGKWQTTWAPPADKMGFFRVLAKLSTGQVLPKLFSRPEGFITYAIVPDPAKRPLYPQSETFFGLQGGFNKQVQVLPYLGARWLLGGYKWRDLEKDKLGEYGEKWRAAQAKGEALPPRHGDGWFVNTPEGEKPWTTYIVPNLYGCDLKFDDVVTVPGTRGDNKAPGALTPEGEKYWRNYCREVGQALPAHYPAMKPHLYEITWEPCYPWGYKGTPEQLIRIYEIAYQALHEVDPNACVIGPCEANINSQATAELLQKGLGKYLDGFSNHPYVGLPPEKNNLHLTIRSGKEKMRQILGKVLPLYGTEQGYPTEEKVEREIIQARGLVRANLIMLGEGWQFNFAFYAVDYRSGAEAGYGFYYNLDPKRNWGPEKWAPKPVAAAYSAMTYLLEGHKAVECLEWLGDTALGYVYERPDSLVLALWDFGDAPRPVVLPVGAPQVTVYDWMGNPRSVACPGGRLELTLTGEPQYITGVSPQVWGSTAHKYLKLAQPRLTGFPGGEATVNVTVAAAPDRKLSARLNLTPDRKLAVAPAGQDLELAAGATREVSLKLSLPADARTGLYSYALTLEEGGTPLAAAGGLLEVAAPVALQSALPAFTADGKAQLQVTLKEAEGRERQGVLKTRLPGAPESSREAAFKLPAGQVAQLDLDYSGLDLSPLVARDLELVVELDNGYAIKETRRINFWSAPRLSQAPQIDGQLGDWSACPALALRGAEMLQRTPEFYAGDADSSVQVRYAWDAQALYVAFEVRDDAFVQRQTGFNTWKDDCLQLALNLDPGKDYVETGNELVDRGERQRYSEIDLALTSNGPEAYRTRTFDQKDYPVGLIPAAELMLKIVSTPAPDGGVVVVYEAAIPWKTLGTSTAPAAGSALGVAATVNDRDSPEQRDPSALGFFPLKNPREFGRLCLGQ